MNSNNIIEEIVNSTGPNVAGTGDSGITWKSNKNKKKLRQIIKRSISK